MPPITPEEPRPASGGCADPPRGTALRVSYRTMAQSWNDGIFGKAAEAAFWQTLSLGPLLLGLLGSVGYVSGLLGADVLDVLQREILRVSGNVFNDSVLEQVIAPTLADVLRNGSPQVVSVGFLLSLWAGSSAISCFVDAIALAHEQHEHRHPVWARIFAVLLFIVFLLVSTVVLPLVALGPQFIVDILPADWHGAAQHAISLGYYPVVGVLVLLALTMLYQLALPRSLPWHRLVPGAVLAATFFLIASAVLRWYLTAVTQSGYSYGALATPITFLLFTYFLGFSIVLGAQLNAAIDYFWPARKSRLEHMRLWLSAQASDAVASSGPKVGDTLRRVTGRGPGN